MITQLEPRKVRPRNLKPQLPKQCQITRLPPTYDARKFITQIATESQSPPFQLKDLVNQKEQTNIQTEMRKHAGVVALKGLNFVLKEMQPCPLRSQVDAAKFQSIRQQYVKVKQGEDASARENRLVLIQKFLEHEGYPQKKKEKYRKRIAEIREFHRVKTQKASSREKSSPRAAYSSSNRVGPTQEPFSIRKSMTRVETGSCNLTQRLNSKFALPVQFKPETQPRTYHQNRALKVDINAVQSYTNNPENSQSAPSHQNTIPKRSSKPLTSSVGTRRPQSMISSRSNFLVMHDNSGSKLLFPSQLSSNVRILDERTRSSNSKLHNDLNNKQLDPSPMLSHGKHPHTQSDTCINKSTGQIRVESDMAVFSQYLMDHLQTETSKTDRFIENIDRRQRRCVSRQEKLVSSIKKSEQKMPAFLAMQVCSADAQDQPALVGANSKQNSKIQEEWALKRMAKYLHKKSKVSDSEELERKAFSCQQRLHEVGSEIKLQEKRKKEISLMKLQKIDRARTVRYSDPSPLLRDPF